MATSNVRQLSLWSVLEEVECRLAQLRAIKPRKRTGVRNETGEISRRGARIGYCSHPDCGGYRLVWAYMGMKICERHWRTRKGLYRIQKSIKARKAAAG